MSDSIARRLADATRIEADRQEIEFERAFCAANAIHWLSHWCWTYDPRPREKLLPFDPFPRQVEFLRWLQEREETISDGLADKSRDMGLTWLCCAYAVHGWLFRDGFKAGFGSRKLGLVDIIGDIDSIFEKMRFILRNLPEWMLPRGFRINDHAAYCKILNPENGSSITGESGDDIGRGGRATIYFLDEAAHIERAEKVDAALSQTTRVRIDISTPNGPGNQFYRRRHGGNVAVFSFHWRDDPRKDDAWYEAECKRIGDPVIIAQELDIDYTASVEGIMIPAAWVRAAVGLPLEPSGRTVAGLDIAEYGRDKNVFFPRRGPVVSMPSEWSQCNTTETAHRANEKSQSLGVAVLSYDCVGVGAGVRGTYESSVRELTFVANAVNTGESASEDYWPDGRTSKERFLNLRAELWWKMRARFERAYEFVTKGVKHPPEDMISIPSHPGLISELSLPLYQRTETGKIKLESKQDMRRRGVKSPNYADAMVLAFADGECQEWDGGIPDIARSIVSRVPRGVFG